MKRLPPAAAAVALIVSACGGPKALELPAEMVDRAATCGVVAAAEARLATNIQDALPFAAQEKIIHYPLLAGAAGDTFVPETANAVSRRMSALQEGITKGKWQDLAPACAAAFPETTKTQITLPANRFDAQLACDSLADFIATALESQESEYINELAPYRQMRTKLNQQLGPGMKSRAGADLDAQRSERNKALAGIARQGSPSAAMKQCVERYG